MDAFQRAHVELLHGRIAFTRPGDGAGPALMVSAGRRLAALDPVRAHECFIDALEMSLRTGRGGRVVDEIIAAARSSAPATGSPDVLAALTSLATDGHRAAAPMLRNALRGEGDPLWTRWPALATMIAADLWETETHATIAEWLVRTGREAGSPVLLRLGLAQKASDATLVGDIGQATWHHPWHEPVFLMLPESATGAASVTIVAGRGCCLRRSGAF